MKVRIKENLSSKRFLIRILLFTLTAVTLLVMLLSIIIYFNVEKIIVQNDFKANKKVFSQIKYNIEYMDEVIKNLGVTLYLNRDMNTLMNGKDVGYYELFTIRDNIVKSIISPNPLIHSVYIYNKNTDSFYSMDDNLFYNDVGARELFNDSVEVPKLKPVGRKVVIESYGSKKYIDVLSYFLYGAANERSIPDSAVILNVNMNWIFDNIKVLNMVDDSNQDKIFILNDKGALIGNGADQEGFKELLSDVYVTRIKDYNINNDLHFYTTKMGNEKYVVTYIKLNRPEWILVKLQPYDMAYQHINSLKSSILFITITFLVLAVLLFIIISKEIYRPVKALVDRIKGDIRSKSIIDNGKDELSLLWNVIDYNYQQLNHYKNEKLSNEELIKAYYLKQLLIDRTSITSEEFEVLKRENNVLFSQNEDIVICVIKIDNYYDFVKRFNEEDISVLKYGIINILTEIFNESFCAEIVDSKQDELTILMNIKAEERLYIQLIKEKLQRAQECILGYLRISISASISQRVRGIKSISKQYNIVLDNMAYRFVYGNLCVITMEIASRNNQNNFIDYTFECERRLLEEIKKGDMENSIDALLKLLSDISALDYSNITLSIMHLLNSLKTTFDTLEVKALKATQVDFNDTHSIETIDQLYFILSKVIQEIIEKKDSRVDEKHMIIVDAVKGIVIQNYNNSNLCLQYIASLLKLSPVVLGKVFKENTMMTVAEYITDVRLNTAVELLEISKDSVQHIMVSVGIENESYFYKLFKKKFGVTPKEYVLKKTIKNVFK